MILQTVLPFAAFLQPNGNCSFLPIWILPILLISLVKLFSNFERKRSISSISCDMVILFVTRKAQAPPKRKGVKVVIGIKA